MIKLGEAKPAMELAVAEYRREYGREPRAILDQEKHEFIADFVRRFASIAVHEIRQEFGGALVLGKSGAKEPLDYPLSKSVSRALSTPSVAQSWELPGNPERNKGKGRSR